MILKYIFIPLLNHIFTGYQLPLNLEELLKKAVTSIWMKIFKNLKFVAKLPKPVTDAAP